MPLSSSGRPVINVRVLSRFPSRIVGATGIAVNTAGGVATVKMNVPGLTANNSTTPGDRVLVSYDPASGETEKIRFDAIAAFLGAIPVADAEAAAAAAHADRLLADADVVLTHADVVLTHADVVATGTALTNVNNAGTAQVGLVNAAGVTQVGAVDTAGTTQTGNVNTAGATQVAAVAAQGVTSTGLVATEGNTQVDRVVAAAQAKIYASVADALSNGVVSVTITAAGSGGTNGAYTVPTTGGGGTQGLARVTVSGGAITAVNAILNKGRGYTSAPTFDLSGITGLTGATLTGVIGQNEPIGRYWGIASATPALYDFYVTATVSTATLLGSAPDLASVTELRNAGGNRNLFPDPFFTDSVLTTGLRGRADLSPYGFSAGWTAIQAPPASSPYPTGKVLVRPTGNVACTLLINLDQLDDAIAGGNSIEVASEVGLLTAGGPYTTQVVFAVSFRDRAGAAVGATTNVTASVANPLDATFRLFRSGSITVPAGAYVMLINSPWLAIAQQYGYASLQITKGTLAASKPIQRPPLADSGNRIRFLEQSSPANPLNNALMRRTAYASTVSNAPQGTGTPGLTGFSAFGGYGSNFLAAACPAVGFNGISTGWQWTPSDTNGPAKITVVVRTAASGNCLNVGTVIAWGYIDCDPTAGNAGSEPIQLFDPVTGAPKTVLPADLGAVFSLAYYGTTKSGGGATNFFFRSCATFSNMDPSFPGYYIPAAVTTTPSGKFGTGFGSVISATAAWYPSLLLMTSPVTATNKPSPSFSASIAGAIEEPPLMLAAPKKMWAIVGRPTWINYQPLLHRDAKRTIFRPAYTWPGTFPANPSGGYAEGVQLQPAAAGTTTLTLEAYNQDTLSDTRTISVVTCAAGAAAGTKSHLQLGDSMTFNSGIQAALLVLATADGVTAITNVGTQGSAPNKQEGYSGQPTGIFFSPGNPFYNPGTLTFDYNYYVANSFAGVSPASHVTLASGFWDVSAATNDAAAVASATSTTNLFTQMIASIHAYDPTIKVAVWAQPSQPRDGADGQARLVTPTVSQGQLTRNLRIQAAAQITAFQGLEASNTFVVCVNAAMNPDTGYPRGAYVPQNDAIAALVNATPYATWAAAQADLTPTDGTIKVITAGTVYIVKAGPNGSGYWRVAMESDGFIRRYSDTIHQSNGVRQIAQQIFAWIKNNP